MKVFIIGGAGVVGSTLAFRLGLSGVVDEIVLLDMKENVLKGHVMDIAQGICEVSDTVVRDGQTPDLSGADIVLMSASMPSNKISNRDELLDANLGIVREAAANIAEYCPEAVVINATAPTDVFNYLFYKFIGGGRRKHIGYNYNDTLRLKWASAKSLGVPARRVDAVVLGEHGERQVPLYEHIYLDKKKIQLPPDQEREIAGIVDNWFAIFQGLKSGRTAGWTSAVGLEMIIAAIVNGSETPIPCSVIPDGEYGHKYTSIGLPVLLGPGGVQKIIEMDISDDSKEKLSQAAGKISKMAQSCL
jgi:malate/lactate dehydrogenase